MPGPLSGLDLIRQVKDERPETLLIVVTAHGSIETAVEAMRLGAHDYVTKPVNLGALRLQVRHAFEHHRLREENRRLRDRLAAARARAGDRRPERRDDRAARPGRPGRRHRRHRADRGRERHRQGADRPRPPRPRRPHASGPFVAANVGALPESLIEGELFGYEKGAFRRRRAARRPAGSRWPPAAPCSSTRSARCRPRAQVDLLRVLEHRELRRLGGEGPSRWTSASSSPPTATSTSWSPRAGCGPTCTTASASSASACRRSASAATTSRNWSSTSSSRPRCGTTARSSRSPGAAMRVLRDHPWPGNVRQLRNVIERLVVTVEGPTIHVDDLPARVDSPSRRGPTTVPTLDAAVAEAETRRHPRRAGPMQPAPRTHRPAAGDQRPHPPLQDEPAEPPVK